MARSRGLDERGLANIAGHINHSNFEVAMLVYNHLSGEGFDAVIPGVEGFFMVYFPTESICVVRWWFVWRIDIGRCVWNNIGVPLLEHRNETIRERALMWVCCVRPMWHWFCEQAIDSYTTIVRVEKWGFASTDDKQSVLILHCLLKIASSWSQIYFGRKRWHSIRFGCIGRVVYMLWRWCVCLCITDQGLSRIWISGTRFAKIERVQ